MPRRYQDYTPSAGLAQMAGGLGMGMARAGQMANNYGGSLIQQDQFDKGLDFRKNQHTDNQKLGYAQIDAGNMRSANSNALGYAQLGQRKAEYDYMVNNPSYQMVNTAEGVYAVDPKNPNTNNRLGGIVPTSAVYPSFKTVKTGDGVYMYDAKNPANSQRLGDLPPAQPRAMTPYQEAQMQKIKQDQMAKLQANYGSSWNDYTPEERAWVANQYNTTGMMPANVDNWGWGRHYPQGYTAPAPTADQSAQLQQLQAILEQQNKLLQQ